MPDDVGAALTGLLAELASSRGAAANFAAPAPQPSTLPMPQLAVESRGVGAPVFEGRMGVPAAGGEIGARGSYQKRNQLSPAEIMAMLSYNRRF